VKTPIAVLISGNGSNLQALMDACATTDFPARIALVISNKPGAYGLTRARNAGIATQVIEHTHYASREAFDEALHAALMQSGAQLVCLAGFMRLLTPGFVARWRGRLINIHPSLLPKFKGAHAIADALAAGETVTGCTVHYVAEEMDAGEVIARAEVPILPGDTLESLSARIHAEEHRIYVEAVRRLVVGC
jgi:phosphoribosylglycinamide formyltransferase-1